MKHNLEDDYEEMMHKNASNWKWIFYFNPKDPRILVPKINPLFGWTLNFGNKYTYIAIFTIVFIIVAFKWFF